MASVTFNFIQKISSLRSKKSQKENVSTHLNRTENIIMEIQNILIWDDPFFSCCCIISVNIVFWLIVYLDFKLYGIFFTTLLILTCEQLWMEHISKYVFKDKSNSTNLTTDSLHKSDSSLVNIKSFFKKGLLMLKEMYAKARFFRQTQPGMFCTLTCMGFLLIGVIGRTCSSVTAFYIFLMLIMTVPGMLNRILPPEIICYVTDLMYSSRSSDNYDEVEPYLPDTSEEALELLQLAGDLELPSKEDDEVSNDLLLEKISGRTSETTESVCSKFSLYPESSEMPSPENSMDYWDFDSTLEEKTEINDIENDGINFQSKHFNGDSSEEEFIKGLNSLNDLTKKCKKSKTHENNSSINTEPKCSTGKKLQSRDIKQKSSIKSEKESSSDSDSFELISEEDM